MATIKRLILDILKPHQPTVIKYAEDIANLDKSYSVTIKVIEIDDKTETVELVIEGQAIDFKKLESLIHKLGGSIHSIDEVSTGKNIIKHFYHDHKR